MSRTDEELLAEWYEDRGKNAPPVRPQDLPPILAGLRIREHERLNTKPLLHCSICNVATRGEHNGLYPKAA